MRGVVCALALVVALLAGCGGPHAVAWRTTAAVRSAGDLTDKAIAASVDREAEKCIKAGKTDAVALRACVQASKPWAALVEWRATVRPAINSALVLTVASLQIAEQAKAKDLDWGAILAPAACAIARALEQWGDLLGGSKAAILAAVGAVKGATCK